MFQWINVSSLGVFLEWAVGDHRKHIPFRDICALAALKKYEDDFSRTDTDDSEDEVLFLKKKQFGAFKMKTPSQKKYS